VLARETETLQLFFVSAYYKVYEELKSKSVGRKAARVNVDFQIRLTTTSVGNAGARRILNHANIISRSKAGTQGQSNRVCESLKWLSNITSGLLDRNK